MAGRLDREFNPWVGSLAFSVRAMAENAAGNRRAAIEALRGAVERAEATGTILYAVPARYRLGQLQGGDEGRELVAEATRAIVDQGIKNPARWVAMQLPGNWGTEVA